MTNTNTTHTNNTDRTQNIGTATTKMMHWFKTHTVKDDNGTHQYTVSICTGYRTSDISEFRITEVAPGETIEGRFCKRCFKSHTA
jgi:hypothetical protein